LTDIAQQQRSQAEVFVRELHRLIVTRDAARLAIHPKHAHLEYLTFDLNAAASAAHRLQTGQ
jgi:hypothetical protein